MTLEMPDTESTADTPQEDKAAKKKRLQRAAWQRWYAGPRGQAWRLARHKKPTVPAK